MDDWGGYFAESGAWGMVGGGEMLLVVLGVDSIATIQSASFGSEGSGLNLVIGKHHLLQMPEFHNRSSTSAVTNIGP